MLESYLINSPNRVLNFYIYKETSDSIRTYLNAIESEFHIMVVSCILCKNLPQPEKGDYSDPDYMVKKRINRLDLSTRNLIYRRSYLQSADMILKLIKGLENLDLEKNLLLRIKEATTSLKSIFHQATNARDSQAHLDERIMGKQKKKKLPADIVIIGASFGDDFSYTTSDGSLGSINVSLETVTLVRLAIENLNNCFEWLTPDSLL